MIKRILPREKQDWLFISPFFSPLLPLFFPENTAQSFTSERPRLAAINFNAKSSSAFQNIMKMSKKLSSSSSKILQAAT